MSFLKFQRQCHVVLQETRKEGESFLNRKYALFFVLGNEEEANDTQSVNLDTLSALFIVNISHMYKINHTLPIKQAKSY